MDVVEHARHVLGLVEEFAQGLDLLRQRAGVHDVELMVHAFQARSRLAGLGGLAHQVLVQAELRAEAHRLRHAQHQRQIDEPRLQGIDLGQAAAVLGQHAVELLAQVRRQHLAQAAPVVVARALQEALGHAGVEHLLGRDFEHQPVGRGEGLVDVRRQRVIAGAQQMERAEQIHRIVGIGNLPQQRHRRRLGRRARGLFAASDSAGGGQRSAQHAGDEQGQNEQLHEPHRQTVSGWGPGEATPGARSELDKRWMGQRLDSDDDSTRPNLHAARPRPTACRSFRRPALPGSGGFPAAAADRSRTR